MPRKVWTDNKINQAYSKVAGLSRKQAKELGLEKEWFAVYRSNKKQFLNVKGKICNILDIAENQELLEYVFKIAVYSIIKSRGVESAVRCFDRVIASYLKYDPLHK
jgi:hypothetical protein